MNEVKSAYENPITSDLSKFEARERKLLVDLLTAWEAQGLPDGFYNSEVTPTLNVTYGNVFLTNEDYQVAMLNGDKLELFYTCPECGWEGFAAESQDHRSTYVIEYSADCAEWHESTFGSGFNDTEARDENERQGIELDLSLLGCSSNT